MSNYSTRYGYLRIVKLPDTFGEIPTVKEEKITLTKDETNLLVNTLMQYRTVKQKQQEAVDMGQNHKLSLLPPRDFI